MFTRKKVHGIGKRAAGGGPCRSGLEEKPQSAMEHFLREKVVSALVLNGRRNGLLFFSL
jgi:hypothetical protein